MRKAACFSVFIMMVFASKAVLAQTYVVGVEEQTLPPYFYQEDGEYQGFARALLDAFAEDAQITLEYQPMPIARLYDDFFGGNVDLKFPDNPNWRADDKEGLDIAYSDTVAEYIDGVMVSSQRMGAGVEALNTLGALRGFTPWDYLDAVDAGDVELSEGSSVEGLLRQAQAERIDGFYFNVLSAEQVVEEQGIDVEFDSDLPHSRGEFMLSSIHHPQLVEKFDAFLADNRDKVAQMKERFGLEDF